MKISFRRLAITGSALAAFAVLLPGSVRADDGDAAVVAAIEAEQATLLAAIEAEQLAIVTALTMHSGQMTVNSNGQSTALSNMQDTADARSTQRAVQQVQVNSVIGATQAPSSCNIITGALGAQSMDSMVEAWRNGLSDAQRDWDKGAPHNGQPTPSTIGRHEVAKAQVAVHCQKGYADDADVASGACPSKGGTPGADLDITAILGHGTMSTDLANNASGFFVTNAVTPVTLGGLPSGFGSTPKGIEIVAERNSDVMRSSVATMILSHLRATRMDQSGQQAQNDPVNNGNTAKVDLKQWAESTAAPTLGYSGTGTNFLNGVSQDDYLKLRAYSWFNNPNWVSSVSTHPEMAQKEIPLILSYMAIQNWKSYELQEQSNAALAMMLAIMEDEHRARRGHSN